MEFNELYAGIVNVDRTSKIKVFRWILRQILFHRRQCFLIQDIQTQGASRFTAGARSQFDFQSRGRFQEGIDLIGNPDEKKRAVDESFNSYKLHCAHRGNPHFAEAVKFIDKTYGDQSNTFGVAVLQKNEMRNGKKVKVPIYDAVGKKIPQLFVFSRVIFACGHCWGEHIRDIIATHFWEVAMLGQLNFYPVKEAVSKMFDTNVNRMVSPVGFLRREILPPMDLGGG